MTDTARPNDAELAVLRAVMRLGCADYCGLEDGRHVWVYADADVVLYLSFTQQVNLVGADGYWEAVDSFRGFSTAGARTGRWITTTPQTQR